MNNHFPLHIHITTVFLVLILTVGSTIGYLGYRNAHRILDTAARDLTAQIELGTIKELDGIISPADMVSRMVARDALIEEGSFVNRMRRVPVLREALRGSDALSSIYLGYPNGDFFFFRRLYDETERAGFDAPAGSIYMVQTIERDDDTAIGRFIFFDESLRLLREDNRPDYAAGYDPRTRSWYRDAVAAAAPVKTRPYLFFSNRKVGMTLAAPASDSQVVVGADILLETLGKSLGERKFTPNTRIALVDLEGFVIAHEDVEALVTIPDEANARPALRRLEDFGTAVHVEAAARLRGLDGTASIDTRVQADDGSWRVSLSPLSLEGSEPLYLFMAIPERELYSEAARLARNSTWLTILIILVAIPATWWVARAVSLPLRRLVEEAESIRRFEFSQPIKVLSRVKEVNDLSRTMDGMKRTIRRFLDLSEAVAAEEDFDRLLAMLLTETLTAADAEAGVLYLFDNDKLQPAFASDKTGRNWTADLSPLAVDEAGPLLRAAIASGHPRTATLSNEDIAADSLRNMVAATESQEAVAVPLLNRKRELVGALLLLHRDAIDSAQLSFVKALSGSSVTSLEARELIRAQKALFESFIQLIASAIDAKSPYTGGHCARVPELTKMLAKAACADEDGPFSGFELSEDEWEALHVAAWLHDCGKVTTPEYVVDKATKLETIYDRIHEIRMRFEVLKRDAEIACYKAIADGEDEATARSKLASRLTQLDEDYAFVAQCNEGGEYLPPADVERLQQIAGQKWLRTLDDRIGISHLEKARKQRSPATSLPVLEPLIADKPEHVFDRREQDRIAPDNEWGFRMEVPERLYNRGELYNLSVSRGTLSEEERYKINEHIVQTLIMLSQLPFPKHLRQVPEIAGGHHEKMDGTGYPKRLLRDEMSVQARMMAIADIFEALTAVDRPYKKGKTLSEAIRIMSLMQKDAHIDPDLFALFLRSGVYLDYAERFMRPEQIDEVDIERYLAAG